jgi:glycosyltransferase involved in cell wall biosynthesis
MKVGIYLRGLSPETGGGYTFERDVLQALVEISMESSHEFVLFSPKKSESDSLLPPDIRNLLTHVIVQPRPKPWLSRAIGKVGRHLGWKKGVESGTSHSLSDAIVRENIEFLWFLTPIHHPVDIPYIATIWDIQHRVQPWFPEVGTWTEWIGREKYISQYVQRAAYIIAPNQVARDEIAFYYQIPPERFILLPHPVPRITLQEPKQMAEILEKYQLTRQGYLLYPAQFWPHKNHVNLLRALKVLKEEYKISFPLVLTGSDKGNLRHVLACAKELGVDERVRFLGFVSREDLIALYQGAFALTFLSLFGPENLPPLEAFVCGCPVIVARVAGAQEQFSDAVLMVDGTRPDEIAGAIKSLCNNPELRDRLIGKGHVRAAAFTAKNYVRGVFAALDRFTAIRQNWGIEYVSKKG